MWTGSHCDLGSGAGVVLEGPSYTSEHALNFGFEATNNEAEYEAVIAGIEMALLVGARRISTSAPPGFCLNIAPR